MGAEAVTHASQLPGIGRTDETVLRLRAPDNSLGMEFQDTTVTRVIKGQAGEKLAGAVPFRVLKIGGHAVSSSAQLREVVVALKASGATELPLVYERCQKLVEVRLRSAEERLGLKFQRDGANVLITGSSGPCAEASVPIGALLRSVNRNPVTSFESVPVLMEEARRGGALSLMLGVEEQPAPIIAEEQPDANGLFSLHQPVTPAQPQLQQQQQQAAGTAATAPPPSFGAQQAQPAGQLPVPGMPPFEPSHNEEHRRFFEKVAFETQNSPDVKKFEFPADAQFWENFRQQVHLQGDEAMRAPHYAVKASHDESSLRVNRQYLKDSVRSWALHNPHKVTVHGPAGQPVTYHASEEFWNAIMARMGHHQPSAERNVLIRSDLTSDVVACTAAEYSATCHEWEQSKGTTPAERAARNSMRWAEIVTARDRREKAAQQRQRSSSGRSDDEAPPPKKASKASSKLVTTGTQWVDPKQFIYLADLPDNQPEQNRIPPYTSPVGSAAAWQQQPRSASAAGSCGLCGAATPEPQSCRACGSPLSQPHAAPPLPPPSPLPSPDRGPVAPSYAGLRHGGDPTNAPPLQFNDNTAQGVSFQRPHQQPQHPQHQPQQYPQHPQHASYPHPQSYPQYSSSAYQPEQSRGSASPIPNASPYRGQAEQAGYNAPGSDNWVSFVREWEGVATSRKAHSMSQRSPSYHQY